MPDLLVYPQTAPLVGSVPVPSDPRIHSLSLILAALGPGVGRIRGDRHPQPVTAILRALQALGVRFEASAGELRVHGVGLFGLTPPDAPLDCGLWAPGETLALLAGLLSAQPFLTTLLGAPEGLSPLLSSLRARGALVQQGDDQGRPSLRVGPLPPADALAAVEYASPGGEPHVKGALLLSGLFAHGATYVREPTLSLDHAERMLQALGAPLTTSGPLVRLDPANWNGELAALDLEVPGDLSAAAFLLVAAQLVPGSRVTARGVGVNPTRAGVLDVLRDSGAGVAIEPGGERLGEPVAELHGFHASVRSFRLGGESASRARDDLMALAVLASLATSEARIEGGPSFRAGLDASAALLAAFGVACARTTEPGAEALTVDGPSRREGALGSADVTSLGDPARAMAATLLGLRGDGVTRVRDVACLGQRYPRFVGTLRALGATIHVVEPRSSG